MPTFKYKARNARSQVVESMIEAENRAEAIKMLMQNRLTPIAVSESASAGQRAASRTLFNFGKPKIKHSELILFTRQLSSILNAGLTLIDTLELLSHQMSKQTAPIVEDITDTIRKGQSLSDALARHPNSFNDTYINMVKVGESGGILSDVFERMASLLEYTEENRQRIKTATRYPKIILSIMVMAFLTIILLIIPKFSGIFERLGTELPLPTRVLMGTYNLITGYWYIILPVVIISAVTYNWWYKHQGRLIMDALFLKMPVFGKLMLKNDIARFARFFASLYKSGVAVTETLTMSARIVDNQVIARLIERMKSAAIQGQPLSAPLKASVFPELAIQMISVGENTGSISDMFERLAKYYESEVDHSIKNLSSLIEPFLIIGLGAMVLLIALGVFLPMWNMMGAFKSGL